MLAKRLSLLTALCIAINCSGQIGTWSQFPSAGPQPTRMFFATAYDSLRNQVVVFGGEQLVTGTALNDTWVWNGASWSHKTPTLSPPARIGASMVFDQAHGQVVLFGGSSSTVNSPVLGDTWVWDGSSWSQRFPASSPAARWLHSMVYDGAHQRVLLFGGSNNLTGSSLGDTWVWDGTNWTQEHPSVSPSPRIQAPMAYDGSRQQVLLYGGSVAVDTSEGVLSDTWAWNGSTWSARTPSPTPGPRFWDGMTYDATSGDVILFGGITTSSLPSDYQTWLWNGANWTETTLGPQIAQSSLVYDTSIGRVVLVGFNEGTGFDETWLWSDTGAIPPPANGSPANNPTSGYSAEPVNTGSGDYYYEHTDFAIASRGVTQLSFQRHYNSIDAFSGPLGANWNHDYNVLLVQPVAEAVTIRWGDGHGESYTLTNGVYVPQPGIHNSLVANADQTFTLTRKDRTQYTFSPLGKLTAIEDKNGNATQLAYDGSGNLVTITAPGGRSLAFAYDTHGRILTVTDPMGREEAYAYDGANDLVTATDPSGGVTTYAYDASHHVTKIVLPNGNTLLQNTYDMQGRVTSQTNGRGYTWQFAYNTPGASQTTITDARGATTVHAYDAAMRFDGILDALNHTTIYSYDANNNRTSVTNQNGKMTNFSYDLNGNVTGVTDPLSSKMAFTYDANNDLLKVTNPKGKTTSFSYDSHGNLIGIQYALGGKTTLTYDSSGELTSRRDALGNGTTFSYSAAGDLTGIRDALGNLTILAYDGDGRLISVKDPNLHTATSAYDALGRLTRVSDPLGHQTNFAYDGIGNLLSTTDANGHKTAYAYDAVNNLVTVTDALGHVTKYSYDQDNNRVGFTNAKGNTTAYQYDALNRLIKTIDPLSFATVCGYDPVGNVLTVTDAKGQTNRFAYDALNRLLSIAYADDKNVAYSYDADGNRTSVADWTGTTTYTHDDLDRLVSVAFPGSKSVSYTYDPNSRRSSLTYPDGKVVEYGYDADARLSTVTDWLSHVTKYAYDPAGNLTLAQYPNKAGISFGYDAANRLTTVANSVVGAGLTFSYTLDPVGNRTKVTEAGIPTVYGYDALDELTSAQTGILKEAWTYDAVGNWLTETLPLGTIKYSYDAADRMLTAGTRTYTYDADGNETSVADSWTRLKRTYVFNAANRLVSVAGAGLTSSFVYDGDGNRVSQSAGGVTQTYVNDIGVALPVVLQDAYNVGAPSSYVYGQNLIESLQGRDDDFYQYDGLGSVIQLTDAAGRPEWSYLYDPWGNSILPAPPTNPFMFAGQALDAITGLYFMRARYYEPTNGRFISRDPARAGRNGYSYAGANPVGWTDPLGLAGILTIYSLSDTAATGIPEELSGHSWIAFAPDGGTTTTYGTYSLSGVDVDKDLPLLSARGVVSRSTYLNDAQQAQLFAVIQGNEAASWLAWAPWDTCAGFAADAWRAATGERLDPTWGGVPTPTALSTSIITANGGNLTGTLSVKPGSTASSTPPATSK